MRTTAARGTGPRKEGWPSVRGGLKRVFMSTGRSGEGRGQRLAGDARGGAPEGGGKGGGWLQTTRHDPRRAPRPSGPALGGGRGGWPGRLAG